MDIKDLYQGQTGKLLKKHLENTVDELDRVSDINLDQTLDKIAVEVISKNKSIEILKEILKLSEGEKEVDNKKVNKKKYGIS